MRRCSVSSRTRWSSCCCRASTRRPRRQREPAATGQGRQRLAGRGRGQGHLRRRPRRGGRQRRGGDSGAPGDQPRRLPRHDRGAGHADQPGRHREPRGGGGARLGMPRRRRRGIRVDQERRLRGRRHDGGKEGDTISIDGTTGEVYAGEITTVEPNFSTTRTCRRCWAGPMSVRRLGSGPTPTTRATPARRRVRRGGHWPLPHRAHVHGGGRLPIVQADDPERLEARAGEQGATALYLEALETLLGYQRATSGACCAAMDGLPGRHPPD